jgi:endoglucanase
VAIHGHLDEIGLIVRSVDKFGLVKFGPIGGWWTSVLTGQRVVVLTAHGHLIGTVGQLAPHQLPPGRRGKELKYEDLWIDIGAASKEEALELVRPGDPVVLEANPHVFDNGRVISRSADNRLGCFIALEVARRSQGFSAEVAAVANGTEEIGGSGAQTAAYDIEPSIACVVDVTPTSDVPGDHDEDVLIGKGPVITIGGFSAPALARELIAVARDEDLAFQLNSAGSHTWTDADDIVRTGEGVPTVVVSVPTRYLHSPGEVFDIADVEATIQLLVAWVKQN